MSFSSIYGTVRQAIHLNDPSGIRIFGAFHTCHRRYAVIVASYDPRLSERERYTWSLI